MRTCVRMGPRPWRPAAELEGALGRGDLRYAVKLAEELRIERGKPIALDIAARFLPLIAAESPGEYDAWAVRWLARWLNEAPAPTIDQAVDVARGLAAVPIEPEAIEAVRAVCRLGPRAAQRC
jgi:hypothetical protein